MHRPSLSSSIHFDEDPYIRSTPSIVNSVGVNDARIFTQGSGCEREIRAFSVKSLPTGSYSL